MPTHHPGARATPTRAAGTGAARPSGRRSPPRRARTPRSCGVDRGREPAGLRGCWRNAPARWRAASLRSASSPAMPSPSSSPTGGRPSSRISRSRASARSRCRSCPIHREREVGFILRHTGARVVFIPGRLRDCDHRELLAGLRPELPALGRRDRRARRRRRAGAHAFASRRGTTAARAPARPTTIALVMYTSGTTADPKGVLHSHRDAARRGPQPRPRARPRRRRRRCSMPSPLDARLGSSCTRFWCPPRSASTRRADAALGPGARAAR